MYTPRANVLLPQNAMTESTLSESLQVLRSQVQSLADELRPTLESYENDLNALKSAAMRLDECSSRSWIGYHAELYYGDFERPPLTDMFDPEWGLLAPFGMRRVSAAWQARTYEEVKDEILRGYSGLPFDAIHERLSSLVTRCRALQTEICTELSYLKDHVGYKSEVDLLGEIEGIKWVRPVDSYIKSMQPKQFFTRDSQAAAQRTRIPHHLRLQATFSSALSIVSYVRYFIDCSLRLIRQV